jgi:hypothetical protein
MSRTCIGYTTCRMSTGWKPYSPYGVQENQNMKTKTKTFVGSARENERQKMFFDFSACSKSKRESLNTQIGISKIVLRNPKTTRKVNVMVIRGV